MKKIFLIVVVIIIVLAGASAAAWYFWPRTSGADLVATGEIQQFITHDFIGLESVAQISKYRSGQGHDFSDGTETCSSMKHYYATLDSVSTSITQEELVSDAYLPVIPIYAPADAVITDIASEQFPLGKQLYLKPDAATSYTIRLFHVAPANGIVTGGHVAAGQEIGKIKSVQQTDVAVEYHPTIGRSVYVSYFDVMTDAVFANYQGYGIVTREQFIISQAERAAEPLTCHGEEFSQTVSDPNDWVVINNAEQNGTGFIGEELGNIPELQLSQTDQSSSGVSGSYCYSDDGTAICVDKIAVADLLNGVNSVTTDGTQTLTLKIDPQGASLKSVDFLVTDRNGGEIDCTVQASQLTDSEYSVQLCVLEPGQYALQAYVVTDQGEVPYYFPIDIE